MTEDDVVSEASVPIVVNFVDDARNPSATTVAPLPDKVDELKNPEGKEKISEQKKADKVDKDEGKDAATSKEEIDDVDENKKDAVAKRVDAISEKAKEAQERINEATKARRQKERELQAEIKKNQDLQKEIERLKTVKPVAAKPKQEDFETETAFIEALTDWKLDARMAAANDLQASQSESNSANQEESHVASIIMQQMKDGSKKYKDFNEVVKNDNTPISIDMVKAISESEIGDEILYYLGTHVDKAEEISEMNMTSAALAIGRIEAELSRPIKKTITKTPPPITPVQTTHSYEPPLGSLTNYEEYKQRRKSQKK